MLCSFFPGFAYLEFQNEEAVENAVKLDGSDFKERQLKVTRKRVNQPVRVFGMQPTVSAVGWLGFAYMHTDSLTLLVI